MYYFSVMRYHDDTVNQLVEKLSFDFLHLVFSLPYLFCKSPLYHKTDVSISVG